jgi:PAS domain S-box-containing protein
VPFNSLRGFVSFEVGVKQTRRAAFLLAVTVAVGEPRAVAQDDPYQYQAKAKFLSVMPGFVEWPAATFKTPTSPLQICVHPDFSFGTSLTELARAETVGGHMLDEISKRDAAMVEERDYFEAAVAQRTRELEVEIGERERAEIALRRSEEMFRTLSAAAPVGIAKLDARGKVTYVNQAWMEMTGLSFDGTLRDGWRTAIHPGDLERIQSTRNAAILQWQDYSMSYRFSAPNGLVWVDTIARGIKGRDGEHLGYVAVTQRRDPAANCGGKHAARQGGCGSGESIQE